MKDLNLRTTLFVLLTAIVFTGCSSNIENNIVGVSASERTIFDAQFERAYKQIDSAPASSKGHVALASLFIKRARSTSDFSLNHKAMAAIDKALEIDPNDLTARKLKASLLATFHRFPEAREAMLELEKETPSDPYVYGILVDANVEIGNYDEAAAAAQKMIDLKPYALSYARAGHIRSLNGDHEGSLKMYEMAFQTSDPVDSEAQSWALVQLAKEHFKYGDLDRSDAAIDKALQILPDYQLAVIEKARIHASRGAFAEAVSILENSNSKMPSTAAHVMLGSIHAKQNNKAGMLEHFAAAEELVKTTDGDMHGFAMVWADHDMRLDEALDIAATDQLTNKDIYGADIMAWCLYKNGRHGEAKVKIAEALRLKSNDARILYHAGMIENALGNQPEARRFLESALKTNPYFDLIHADAAKKALQIWN